VPTFELRFAPRPNGGTAAELRYLRLYEVGNDTIWPTVEKCGGNQ
jgi:hypothetical protein